MIRSQKVSPLIKFENVSFKYKKRQPLLLNEVSFNVLSGQRVGIMGDNGSGKSTIAKLLLGLIVPEKGNIYVEGHRAIGTHHYSNLSYIGDPGYNAEELGLPQQLTVLQMLNIFSRIQGVHFERKNYIDLKDGLGIDKIQQKSIRNLSTGERKRLMICIALSKKPSLLILDEPLDGLDISTKAFVHQELQKAAKRNTAFLYIAHDIVEIDRHTEISYRLHEGQLSLREKQLFDVNWTENGTTTHSQYKLGVFQGRLQDKISQGIDSNGFSLSIKPV